MAPLHGQRPLADDPFEPDRGPDADDTPAETRMRRANRSGAKTEPGFKIPYSWIRSAWDALRPLLLPYLGSAAIGLGIVKVAGSAEPPRPAPQPAVVTLASAPDDARRLERFEGRLSALENTVSKMDGKLDVLIGRSGGK